MILVKCKNFACKKCLEPSPGRKITNILNYLGQRNLFESFLRNFLLGQNTYSQRTTTLVARWLYVFWLGRGFGHFQHEPSLYIRIFLLGLWWHNLLFQQASQNPRKSHFWRLVNKNRDRISKTYFRFVFMFVMKNLLRKFHFDWLTTGREKRDSQALTTPLKCKTE